MTASLGASAVWGVLVGGIATLAASAFGRRRSSTVLLWATCASTVVGATLLASALVGVDLRIAYVVDFASERSAWPYRLSGLWAGLGGSLLLWAAALGLVAVGAVRRLADGKTKARVVGAAGGALALVVTPAIWFERPFRLRDSPAAASGGLVPVLEHPAMLIHPPLVYAALAALTVAAAVVAAGRLAGPVEWHLVRALLLGGVAALTIAIALGAGWAYVELGWGGFWAWDPVENSALVPWLLAVAALHAPLHPAAEPSRARLWLLVAPGLAALAGGVLTRSGVAASVHAFGQAGRTGAVLAAGLAGAIAATALAIHASSQPHPHRTLADTHPDSSVHDARTPSPARIARWLLILACVPVAIGTLAPVVASASDERTIAPWFFALFAGPPLVAAGLLAGLRVGRRAGRRRIAAAAAHAGAAVLALALIATSLGDDASMATLSASPSSVGGVTLAVTDINEASGSRWRGLEADLTIRAWGMTAIRAVALRAYDGVTAPQPEAAVATSPVGDVVVVPRRIDRASGTVTADVHTRPAMVWVWFAAVLMAGGVAASALRRLPAAPAEQLIDRRHVGVRSRSRGVGSGLFGLGVHVGVGGRRARSTR